MNARIKLVAIISLHSFFKNRSKIRNEVPGAWVLPALPKAKYWKFSNWVFAFICLLTRERVVISRNVLATQIALFSRKLGLVNKVCLDGRGAIAAEWNEYEVVAHDKMKTGVASWEKTAVLAADFRIAVSQKLVDWWFSAYGYNDSNYVIIPCTLQSAFKLTVSQPDEITLLRTNAGFSDDDIIMVYSGSTSGWQSFTALETLLGFILSKSKQYKLVFLSNDDTTINSMKNKYPGQVFNTWLNHTKVQSYLTMCDYGILYREQSVTNQVAAPTKFAEYLSAGLPVMISEGIGDYSDFVKQHDCGMVISESVYPEIAHTTTETRIRMVELAKKFFTKEANSQNYKLLLRALETN